MIASIRAMTTAPPAKQSVLPTIAACTLAGCAAASGFKASAEMVKNENKAKEQEGEMTSYIW